MKRKGQRPLNDFPGWVVMLLLAGLAAASPARAQTMTLSVSSSDFVVNPSFGNVDFFTIDVQINRPLAPGLYINPPIIDVAYQVRGTLPPGTPSGGQTVNLQRYMSGAEFYAQGSSLRFEISRNAVLIDGVQVAELVGTGTVLTFNAREINTGRFTPPQLTLDASSTGRFQNSNNVPSVEPLVSVDFGQEYITNLLFDPGNRTVIIATPTGGVIDDDDGGTVCIISSLVKGTWLEPGLKRLREFRDRFLMRFDNGQRFVAWYYRISPALTQSVEQYKALRALATAMLTPLIFSIQYPVAAFLVVVLIITCRCRNSLRLLTQ